ncbi:AraC family transcriptional regulator [Chachezhania sediminis]|uniref:AraC family transcriptional regulator n=1 Tax=Chachezhania sediminis TaxID=2599291 RepID=UPI00131CBF68|nr:AraC family transcriptional regulator [Chachezhania sediminis]
MTRSYQTDISTVSHSLIEDWLAALHGYCSKEQMTRFLQEAGFAASAHGTGGRVTLDEIVRLYQVAATRTGDEMMGLWSRPIRQRALQHLATTVREASSLPAVLYRFSTFWNLLLDDFQFELDRNEGRLTLSLVPRQAGAVQRFGHMLILKLAHGLLSWRAGREVPVAAVFFAFERPAFAEDYPLLFPAPIRFGMRHSAIAFDTARLGPAIERSNAEMAAFLERAPRDWLFTSFHEHNLSLRIRDMLFSADWLDCRLSQIAPKLGMTPRTLIRHLHANDTSFQAIKDGLRRDMAIRDLQAGRKGIEEISYGLGFSSSSNFHRAFRRWTGVPPSAYRIRSG